MDVTQDNFKPQNYLPQRDGPDDIGLFAKDLAFELFAVPEPGGVVFVLGAVLAWFRRRRVVS